MLDLATIYYFETAKTRLSAKGRKKENY